MRHKKNIIIGVMCIAVLIMGLGYALLSTQIDISGSTAVTSTWKIEFSDIRTKELNGGATNVVAPTAQGTSASFEVDLVLPGDYVLYEIDITNYGDIDAEVKGASYNVSGSDSIYVYVDGIKKGTKLPSCEGLDTCPTITLTLKVGYDSGIISEPTEKRKDIEFSIEVGQYVEDNPTPESDLIPELSLITLSNKIFANNNVYADNAKSEFVSSSTGIDFSSPSSDTNGKGLYYTSTNTEDNKTTYYFRGAVENNYVQFGVYKAGTTVNGTTYNVDTPIYWKIIRINEDGSIRLIYNGTSTTATGSNVTIGNSNFNTNYDDNAYVGYMYGTTGSSTYALTHANTNNSTIKGVIDNWYSNNTNLSSLRETHLADAGFCNDRSVASTSGTWYSNDTALGYAKNVTYYGAYNRLYKNKKPQFACPNASNDLFTTSTSSKGNKALTVPIGLITADEVWYAGATTSTNQTHYLYTGANYWTMSPRSFDGYSAGERSVRSNGSLSNGTVNLSNGVRPVANLQSGVEIINGDGTSGNPYVIK